MCGCDSKLRSDLTNTTAARYRSAVDSLQGTPEQQKQGVATLKNMAAAANHAAMMALAKYFEKKKKTEEAIRWYSQAAALGFTAAKHRLAVMRFHGSGLPRNQGQAIAELEELAMKNHASSQAHLGLLYKGKSELHCPPLAFSYLQMAAENGSVRGLIGLGDCYKSGCGVEADPAKAVEQYRAAVGRGHKGAMYSLGSLLLKVAKEAKEYEEGVMWVRRAAEKDNLEAMFHMGYLYHNGDCGVTRDVSKALEWYKKAAHGGHGKSYFQLGKMYEGGAGLACKPPVSAHYFRQGADGGHAPCMNSLGLCYAKGFGVPLDLCRAREYYLKAAALNDVRGLVNSAACLLRGIGGPVDEAGAVEALKKAAHQNHIRAYVQLGNCYMLGQGVAKDGQKALECYGKARAAGDLLGLYNYAVTLLREYPGDESKAREAERLLLPNWDHGLSMLSLGRLYLQQGKREEGIKYLERSMELNEAEACHSAGAVLRGERWRFRSEGVGMLQARRSASSCWLHGRVGIV